MQHESPRLGGIQVPARLPPISIQPVSAPELPLILEELGLLDRAEIVHPGIRVSELISRNIAFRLERAGGGPGYFAKQPQMLTPTMVAKIAAEARLTAHLTDIGLPGLPALLADDRRSALLVYELVQGATLSLDEPAPTGTFRALGQVLAALHDAPVAQGLPTSDRPVLADPARWENPPADLVTALSLLSRDPRIRMGYQWLADAWTTDAIIHGDIKPTNVLVAPNGAPRLIDWEMGGLGDARWDLGMAIGYVLAEFVFRALAFGSDQEPLGEVLQRSRTATQDLLTGYGQTSNGSATSDLTTLGTCAALAIAQFVMVLGRGANRPTRAMVQLTQIALNALDRPDEAMTSLFGDVPQ